MTPPWWLVPAWLDEELRRYLAACDEEIDTGMGGEHGQGQQDPAGETACPEHPPDGERPPAGR